MKKLYLIYFAVFILLSMASCDGAGMYLTRETPFAVKTWNSSGPVQEGARLEPGSSLSLSLEGYSYDHMTDISLSVSLVRIYPQGSSARASSDGYAQILLAEYLSGALSASSPLAGKTGETEPPSATQNDQLEKSESSLDEDGAADTSAPDQSDTDGKVLETVDYNLKDESRDIPSITHPVPDPIVHSVGSLSSSLPSFSLPLLLPAGPYEIIYELKSNEEILETRSLHIFAISDEGFFIEGLAAYPPGPSGIQPVLGCETVALFEAKVQSPNELNPDVRWYFSGKMIERTPLEDNRSYLLHAMPKEEGIYTIKIEVYPVNPSQYPSFPLVPLTQTLSLAVSKSAEGFLSAGLDGADPLLVFPLRGKLNAMDKKEISLIPLAPGMQASWDPIKNDFGLLTGPGATWLLNSFGGESDALGMGARRILWDGAVISDGLVASGSLVFRDDAQVSWQLVFKPETVSVLFRVPNEEEVLNLIIERPLAESGSRQWYALDFELISNRLLVRATMQGIRPVFLELEVPEDYERFGSLSLGSIAPSTSILRGTAVLHQIAIGAIPKFYGEYRKEMEEIDDTGEIFLEI